MEQKIDDPQRKISDTRQEMAESRASMTEKLELLEERVRDTVESAKSTGEDILDDVQETLEETVGAVKEMVGETRATAAGMVEDIKDAVKESVAGVKRIVDLPSQVDQHPWAMLSGAVLVGYLVGGLGTGRKASSVKTRRAWTGGETQRREYFATPPSPEVEHHQATASQSHTPPSSLSVLGQFREEFDMLKGAIIVALMSPVRELVKQSLPGMAPQLEQAIESATAKLGGQPFTAREPKEQRAAGSPSESRDRPPTI
jgi:hypothetical protein